MDQSVQIRFYNFISIKGLKASRQRASILDVFLSTDFQVSADELYIKLRKTDPTLGRATVYRTLKLLTEAGLAIVTNKQGSSVLYRKIDEL